MIWSVVCRCVAGVLPRGRHVGGCGAQGVGEAGGWLGERVREPGQDDAPLFLRPAAHGQDPHARGAMAANEAGTVVTPHPAATRCSLVIQSRAVWVILGRSSSPGQTPIRVSSAEE